MKLSMKSGSVGVACFAGVVFCVVSWGLIRLISCVAQVDVVRDRVESEEVKRKRIMIEASYGHGDHGDYLYQGPIYFNDQSSPSASLIDLGRGGGDA